MAIRPTASATLGNLRYDQQLADVRVSLALLPGADWFEATLPHGVEVTAQPGDPALLVLDGGDGPTDVLTGKVRAIRRTLAGQRVLATDGSADLAALRPNVTYEKQNAKHVIRALAADAGVDTGQLDVDVDLAAYVAAPRRTASEHIAYLAGLGGALASFDAGGALLIAPRPRGPADLALRHGRELVVYETAEQSGSPVTYAVIGSGPAGTGSAPDALRHTLAPVPKAAPSAGPAAVRRPAAVIRTPGAASAATEAANAAALAASTRVFARCWCLPALRPGLVVEIQDLPDGPQAGPWLLSTVTHRLRAGAGGETAFMGTLGGDALGGLLGSLLGAALGAVGSLL